MILLLVRVWFHGDGGGYLGSKIKALTLGVILVLSSLACWLSYVGEAKSGEL
jgi:hypothetical protein